MNCRVKIAVGLKNNPTAADIRTEVFVSEQGFKNEFDEIDDGAVHAVLFEGDTPAATGRLYGERGVFHIGRVAVLKQYRGKGLGAKIMTALENAALKSGGGEIVLSAQTQAEGFYKALGYESRGEIYLDEHCPHIEMVKKVCKSSDDN